MNSSNKITGLRKNSIPCLQLNTNQNSNEPTTQNEVSLEFDLNCNETWPSNSNDIHQDCLQKNIAKDLEIYKLKEKIESLQSTKTQNTIKINALKEENKGLRDNISKLEETNERLKDIFMKSRDHQDNNKVNMCFIFSSEYWLQLVIFILLWLYAIRNLNLF